MPEIIHYRFANWQKHQARSDRRMPWIKLWREVLNHRVWELNPSEWKVFSYLLLTANEQGSIRLRSDFIQTSCRVRHEFVQSSLSKLVEFGVLTSDLSAAEDKIRQDKIRIGTASDKKSPPKASQSANADAQMLLKIWNENCGPELPKAQKFTPSRLRSAKSRWRENPSRDFWVDVVSRMARSEFLCGGGNTGWRASFDFLLRPDTAVKVLEGKYDSGKKQKANLAGRFE